VNAYWPHDPLVLAWLTILLAILVLLGYWCARLRPAILGRIGAWSLVVFGGAAAERLCAAEPDGLRMLAIIGALLYSMKGVVGVESVIAGEPRLTPVQWLAFAVGWFGMRPGLFASLGRPARSGVGSLIREGLIRLIAGTCLLVLARLVWVMRSSSSESAARFTATVLALPGLSLFLHFGIFDLLAAMWHLAGVDCRPFFRAPLYSTSLSEFWGRRWNLAFSEMTAIGIFRPLSTAIGRRAATAAAFLVSGLLHELAISLPVRAGFGGPLLYFLIQGGLILIEGRFEAADKTVKRIAWTGRLWTAVWLLAPLPILFHRPFLNGVIWPLFGMEIAE